jgi:hypothetical protein
MKNRMLLIFTVLIYGIFSAKAQENCNHEAIILDFLKKISSIDYKPILGDYNRFFDSHSEIEDELRYEYSTKYPDAKLSNDSNSISLSIECVINHETIKRLIEKQYRKNCKWKINKRYNYGTATIIYEIGIDCSKEVFKFQMSNWAYKNRCGIDDIIDSSNRSILYKNRILKR